MDITIGDLRAMARDMGTTLGFWFEGVRFTINDAGDTVRIGFANVYRGCTFSECLQLGFPRNARTIRKYAEYYYYAEWPGRPADRTPSMDLAACHAAEAALADDIVMYHLPALTKGRWIWMPIFRVYRGGDFSDRRFTLLCRRVMREYGRRLGIGLGTDHSEAGDVLNIGQQHFVHRP